jgi:imidazolonepropionase-like amidohydrolase
VSSAVKRFLLAGLLLVSLSARAAAEDELRPFVKVDSPAVALAHVRVIDGSGGPGRADQTVVIRQGRIELVADAASARVPKDALVLELRDHTVIPGLVGMHDHLFYTASLNRDAQGRTPPPGALVDELAFSAPRLYLACGVTTLRTTGSIEPYADLNVRSQIESRKMPGPRIDVTGPYLEGPGTFFPQMHELTGPDDARKLVEYWADAGVTSFKAYMHITRAELGAAIEAAHARGLKLTGHLCSVGYREAAALGIDDLEHGPIFADSELVADKQPDVCPPSGPALEAWARTDIGSPTVQDLIRELVARHVAVTSTLPVFELLVPGRPPVQPRILEAMALESRTSYLAQRARVSSVAGVAQGPPWEALFKKEMQFEQAFAKAGGLLLAGPDPTGIGGVLPGFGDQREVELLVEAGFTPEEAIGIATRNGAQYLGRTDEIGTVAPGRRADLVVVKGDPSKKIDDIEQVEIVFRDGIGYDPAKLVDSVRGQVGIR